MTAPGQVHVLNEAACAHSTEATKKGAAGDVVEPSASTTSSVEVLSPLGQNPGVSMPKITEPTVAEHVAHQEAAVFDAAIELFIEEGYEHVTMAEIAAKVGLARNSLYRYFPDKAHIVVRWFRTELPIQVALAADALSGDAPIALRLRRYVDAQLDYAATPAHALITSLVEVVPTLDRQVRLEFMASHRDLLAPLDDALRQAGLSDATDRSIVADLIGGLINAGASREARVGRDEITRERIVAAIEQLISTPEPSQEGSEQAPSNPIREA